MKKTILYGVLALAFAGCTLNNNPEPANEAKQEPAVQEEKTQDVVKEKVVEKPKKIAFKFYEIIPNQIEVFPYGRLSSNTVINDKKLNNSFYVKGNFVRIERVYISEIGDQYGKIVGKNLLVSMDDLVESNRKAY